MTRTDLEREAVEAQRAVYRELFRTTIAGLLDTEITMAQLKALALADREPDCSIGLVAEGLRVKVPAASLLVDRLVRSELAERVRDPGDGRRVLVRPTAAGRELLARVRHGGESRLHGLVSGLSDDELAALARGSQALAAAAQAGTPSWQTDRRPAGARP